jgi:hypothetical protein
VAPDTVGASSNFGSDPGAIVGASESSCAPIDPTWIVGIDTCPGGVGVGMPRPAGPREGGGVDVGIIVGASLGSSILADAGGRVATLNGVVWPHRVHPIAATVPSRSSSQT